MKTKQKQIVLCLFIVLTILFSYSANAISATVLTGMMRITVEEVPTEIQKSIGVRNTNNVTVNVVFEPGDSIKEILEIEENNLTLQPGEDRFVNITLSITENKNYDDSINAIFSKINVSKNKTDDKVGMSMRIIIKQLNQNNETTQNNETQIPEESNENSNLWIYGLAGVVILIILIIILLRRRKK